MKQQANKVNIANIKLNQLDAKSLIWMSKISRALKKNDGVIINLQSKDVLNAIVVASKRSNNTEVHALYTQLKRSLRAHINSKQFDAQQLKGLLTQEWQSARSAA